MSLSTISDMDMNGWRVVSADDSRILGSRQAAHIIKAKWEDKGIECWIEGPGEWFE